MINGLGVVGWGVGGIEAEAVMLGQPIYMLTPEVVGFKLTGSLPEGATATDLVLTVTQMLRAHGVVGKFVEFYGPGLAHMGLADRATLANMAPEYGATMGFFPVDEETLNYLRRTGRPKELVDLVERYYKEQGMFRTANSPDPRFTSTLELELSTVAPSMAGPKRPQDRILLSAMKSQWEQDLRNLFGKITRAKDSTAESMTDEGGLVNAPAAVAVSDPGLDGVEVELDGQTGCLKARGGGHRGHHQLHQHQQSFRDDRSGTARPECRRPGTPAKALGQIQPGSRQPGGDGLPQAFGTRQGIGQVGLSNRGLWLHDLHRQQRPASRPGVQSRRSE